MNLLKNFPSIVWNTYMFRFEGGWLRGYSQKALWSLIFVIFAINFFLGASEDFLLLIGGGLISSGLISGLIDVALVLAVKRFYGDDKMVAVACGVLASRIFYLACTLIGFSTLGFIGTIWFAIVLYKLTQHQRKLRSQIV